MAFIREAANPLVTPEMVVPSLPGFRVVCTFNAGVAQYAGETLLLLRVAEKPPQAPEGYAIPDDATSEVITISADNAGTTITVTFEDPKVEEPPKPKPPEKPEKPKIKRKK